MINETTAVKYNRIDIGFSARSATALPTKVACSSLFCPPFRLPSPCPEKTQPPMSMTYRVINDLRVNVIRLR